MPGLDKRNVVSIMDAGFQGVSGIQKPNLVVAT